MSDTKQLSLFEPQFDQRIRRVEIDGVMHFSVLDIFAHCGSGGSAKNPTAYWKRVVTRIVKQGGDLTGVLDRPVETGGRPTPFITNKAFWRIVQVSEIKEWEPLRQWMATLAGERIEEFANPDLIQPRAIQREIEAWRGKGMSEAWIKQRILGRQTRNVLTATAQETHITHTPQYAALTARTYTEMLGMSKAEIVKALKLSAKEANVFRDHLNELALRAIDSAEVAASLWMQSLERPLTDQEQMDIVIDASRELAPAFHRLAGRIGMNLATGQRQIGAGNTKGL